MDNKTFGPAFVEHIDGKRIKRQHEVIRDYMLRTGWKTLGEIERALGYPQASISAQLRHLRKPCFGNHIVQKRRRTDGTWEYSVTEVACEPGQLSLAVSPIGGKK